MTEKKYRWPEIRKKWAFKFGYADAPGGGPNAISTETLLELLGLPGHKDMGPAEWNDAEDLIDRMKAALEEEARPKYWVPHDIREGCSTCYELGRHDERPVGRSEKAQAYQPPAIRLSERLHPEKRAAAIECCTCGSPAVGHVKYGPHCRLEPGK